VGATFGGKLEMMHENRKKTNVDQENGRSNDLLGKSTNPGPLAFFRRCEKEKQSKNGAS